MWDCIDVEDYDNRIIVVTITPKDQFYLFYKGDAH